MTPTQAREEIAQRQRNEKRAARRELARRTLIDFTKYTLPSYVAEPVHILIADALDRCVSGEIKKLMIFAPPQHGKSELVSVRLPAYWLGKRPNDPILLGSYGGDLAEDKSREARALVESQEYREVFPKLQTNRTSRAVNRWHLMPPNRGYMRSAGVDGTVTGHGARLGIIDDPHKDWAEAQSSTKRRHAVEWWRGTWRPRLWEDCCQILIMTRWHEDDLAGWLLANQPGEWTVLRLPAIAETQHDRDERHRKMGLPPGLPDPLGRAPGEPLSPLRYSLEAELELMRDVGSLVAQAEYMGAPTAPEGQTFKRDWFPIVDALPLPLKLVRWWDKAATEGGGAYSAGVLMGYHEESGLFIIVDVVRGQWSSRQREVIMRQTAELDEIRFGKDVKIWMEQEPGSSGKDSKEESIQNLAGYDVHGEPSTGDKDVRLQPFAAQCEAMNVRLLRGVWNADFIDEAAAIPNGKYRDQTDAAGAALIKLKLHKPKKAQTSAPNVVTTDQLFGR